MPCALMMMTAWMFSMTLRYTFVDAYVLTTRHYNLVNRGQLLRCAVEYKHELGLLNTVFGEKNMRMRSVRFRNVRYYSRVVIF